MVKNTTCECYLTPAKDACLSKGTVNGVVHTSYKSACEALGYQRQSGLSA